MKVPYKPEPHDALRARFGAALSPVYSVAFVERFPTEGPSGKPEHVFDLVDADGTQYRVIISVDEHRELGRFLHASVSCDRGIPCVHTACHAFAIVHGPGRVGLRSSAVTRLCTHLFFDPPKEAL